VEHGDMSMEHGVWSMECGGVSVERGAGRGVLTKKNLFTMGKEVFLWIL